VTCKAAGLGVVIGLALAARGLAAPPQISGTTPLGVQRGVVSEVTIQGANLSGNPMLVAPFGFEVEPPAAPTTDAAGWKLKVNVAAGTPVGVYPIRVKTDDGLSNPFLFSVGQLAQVAEKEENNAFESAQAIPSPVVVEGKAEGNDVDYFRFAGKKGERIVVDAQCARIGSGVDPSIRLTTAGRAYVASADDSAGLLSDARLTAILPEDADYVIELSDSRYQGGGRPVYRLVVGAVPVADEIFPLGGRQGETVGFELRGGNLPDLKVSAATVAAIPDWNVFALRATNQALGMAAPAEPVLDVESLPPMVVSQLPELREPADPNAPPVRAAAPVALNGRLDPAGDEDRYVLAVAPGQRLRIVVDAAELGSALDGVLQVMGANDAVLATADDTTTPVPGKTPKAAAIISPDPALDFTVPAGLSEVTLALRDLQGRGGTGYAYRITVEPIVPSFKIALNDLQMSIPKDGTAAVGVTVARQGYNGPIALSVANPPAGLTVRPGTIADGQAVGSFTVSASPDAAFGVVTLQVIGTGQGPGGPIVRAATKEVVFAQQALLQATLPTNTSTQTGLAVAPALTTAVKLDAPATPIEVVHGFGVAIEVKVERSAGADAALAVTPLPLPPGLAVPAVNIAEKVATGSVTVTVAPEVPLGLMTIALTAKGKIADAERVFAVPAVTLNVVRPVAITLDAPSTEVKAGATVEVKGKVERKAPFKEPVTVKVTGLPAGLKADPVTVAPSESDFTLKIVADPKAAAASAAAGVAPGFQINKKDYATPPTTLAVKVVPAS